MVKIKRNEALQSIAGKLGWLKNQIELENEINLYNNNIGSENFMCGLLNLIYSWNLINLNQKDKNFPGIDLGDENKKIAIQITSDNTRKKVKDTINTFLKHEHEKIYSRLVIVVLGNKTTFNKDFDTQNRFVFDRKNDVIDINQIIKDLDKCDNDEIIFKVQSYIEEKLQMSDNIGICTETCDFVLEERKKVYAMCLMKLRALGISKQLGALIIEEEIMKKQHDFVEKNGVKFLVGDFGSGKSHLLYTSMLILIDRYLKKETDKLPVFFEASDIKQYNSIQEYCQKFTINFEQAIIIIDSLDEVDYQMIEKIVNEVDYLDNRYDEINIIIGSRHMSFLVDRTRIVEMPLLSDNEINELYAKITGDSHFRVEYRFGKDKQRMEMILRKPFFAIIYAIYMKDHDLCLRNEADLVNCFIEKSLQPFLLKNPKIYMYFEKLSILSIDRNYGSIHKSEIPVDINVEELIKSGFIRMQGSENIIFTLPILVQWLGARAIREKLADFFEIVNDESRLLKWRYSLSIMFNQMTYEESENYFSYLVENKVGLVGLIIRDGISFEGEIDISDSLQSGQKLYKCMQSWAKGLGNLAEDLDISNNGVINTLAISCAGKRIEYSWANSYLNKDVICMDDDIYLHGFKTMYARNVPAQATWPWVVTFEYLSELIENRLKNKNWLVLDGVMEQEFVWKNTLELKHKGSLYTGSFELADIDTYRTRTISTNKVDRNTYFYLIDRLKERGISQIEVPYIVGDRDKTSFIWGSYSREQMKLRIKTIYENVLEEYSKMVDSLLGCFKMHLSLYLLLPCKWVVSLCYDEDDICTEPNLQYYMEPLPLETESIVEIDLQNGRNYFEPKRSTNIFEKMRVAVDRYRGGQKEFISLSIHGERYAHSSSTPVTDIVYKMLIDDLKKIAWIKT